MAMYKLVYFNAGGRAEVIRFIFAQAGVAYEDKRVERGEWEKLKPTTPTGEVPLLEVDGKVLHGSKPIARFLAKRFGLAGDNDLQAAELDGTIDFLSDFVEKLVVMFYEQDEEKKGKLMETIKEVHVPRYWSLFEKWIQENNSEGGWINGDKPTYADFHIYCTLEILVKMFPGFLVQYPALAKLKEAVETLPNIAKWLKERPKTDH